MNIHRVMCAAGFAVLSAWASAGCYVGDRWNDDSSRVDLVPPTDPTTASTVVGQGGAFVGSLGQFDDFVTGETEMRITTSRSGSTVNSSVRLDAVDAAERRWVMTQLTVSGGLLNPTFTPGMTATFSSASAAAVGVRVLGCSGPARGDYTYDHTADRVTVRVEEGPRENSRRMVFDATFSGPSGPQTLRGSFVYDTE